MEIERQRVQDDLRGIVAGEVYCDPLMTQLYASDASIYQLQPLGVVRPRSTQDVLSVVQYAAEHEISIHPRGAGTGVSGESLGRGIVIDFSQSMRRIESDPDDLCVKVQSGAALAVLNRNLSVRGRWYGPDPVAECHHYRWSSLHECFEEPLPAKWIGTRYGGVVECRDC